MAINQPTPDYVENAGGQRERTRWAVGKMGRVVVIRLAPGDDIMPSILAIAQQAGIGQGIVRMHHPAQHGS